MSHFSTGTESGHLLSQQFTPAHQQLVIWNQARLSIVFCIVISNSGGSQTESHITTSGGNVTWWEYLNQQDNSLLLVWGMRRNSTQCKQDNRCHDQWLFQAPLQRMMLLLQWRGVFDYWEKFNQLISKNSGRNSTFFYVRRKAIIYVYLSLFSLLTVISCIIICQYHNQPCCTCCSTGLTSSC